MASAATVEVAKKEPAAEEGLGQEEADAVAALLDFGIEESAPAGGEAGADIKAEPTGPRQPEYLVKWQGKAHIYNEWLSVSPVPWPVWRLQSGDCGCEVALCSTTEQCGWLQGG